MFVQYEGEEWCIFKVNEDLKSSTSAVRSAHRCFGWSLQVQNQLASMTHPTTPFKTGAARRTQAFKKLPLSHEAKVGFEIARRSPDRSWGDVIRPFKSAPAVAAPGLVWTGPCATAAPAGGRANNGLFGAAAPSRLSFRVPLRVTCMVWPTAPILENAVDSGVSAATPAAPG